ncbi:uncharacterized protein MELLADRAFT_123892 [Melampsora larici-populina 98AG31]|uniref:Secreted protein n=1 Tax=Melampsora larici-populina (strain 98AG31 / pathotype 3-4-7) TaxID=747676 RepID=F4S142_MELLP|nr:uncharacterized protein MELLADRAFT_123892 [Melampsora larici-populina 98AG31]EGG01703.1 secreted protein [Melampsora larici-populina 98AG31]
MRCSIFLGFLLQVLFVMAYPEPNSRLEGRDSSGLESIQPKKLFKRMTSPSNPVVCPGQLQSKPLEFDLKQYGKMITALISRPASCVFFANLGMYVETTTREPAMFQDSSASSVRNYYGAYISQTCRVTKPVTPSSKVPPPSPDDDLVIVLVYYGDYADSKQVETCDKETEDAMRAFGDQL